MAARLAMLAPRLIALIVIWLLAAASWTLAAGGQESSQPAAPAAAEQPNPDVLVVPEVRRQAYVFAKGILQDAGFAWRVEGTVRGYAGNTVVSQAPAAGVRVVDNGAPTVVLRLRRSDEYEERGVPENTSAYIGTAVVLLRDWHGAQEEEAQPATETQPAATTPTPPVPATAPKEGNEGAAYREPDFVVEGAPREPADELPLPKRALALKGRAAALRKPTPRFVDHWLYQHAWLVTGARFGWKNGDDALRTLIQVDRSLYVRFGFGARSERVARLALAFVEARKS
jgi:hypothetical protein